MLLELFDRIVVWLSQRSHDREAQRRLSSICRHRCSFGGCQEDAVHWIQWGTSDKQQGNVCQKHMRETWDKVSSQVQQGCCWWTQSPVR